MRYKVYYGSDHGYIIEDHLNNIETDWIPRLSIDGFFCDPIDNILEQLQNA